MSPLRNRNCDNDFQEFPSWGAWYIYRELRISVCRLSAASLYCAVRSVVGVTVYKYKGKKMDKKKKTVSVEVENRRFLPEWTDSYYFVLSNKVGPVCLICQMVNENRLQNLRI